jgi:hypothetical protein
VEILNIKGDLLSLDVFAKCALTNPGRNRQALGGHVVVENRVGLGVFFTSGHF